MRSSPRRVRADERLDTDGSAIASGAAATDAGGTSIGVGVAINYVRVTNTATVPAGATIASGGAVTVRAGMATGATHAFVASATSGAGGGDIGLAGSVAIDIVRLTTTATVALTADVEAGTTDEVTVEAASTSSMTTSALPASALVGADSLGIVVGSWLGMDETRAPPSSAGSPVVGPHRRPHGELMTTSARSGTRVATSRSPLGRGRHQQVTTSVLATTPAHGERRCDISATQTASAVTTAQGEPAAGRSDRTRSPDIANHTGSRFFHRAGRHAGGSVTTLDTTPPRRDATASSAAAPSDDAMKRPM